MSKIIFQNTSDPKIDEIKMISKKLGNTDRKCSRRCKLTTGYGLSTCKVKLGLGFVEMSYDPAVSNVLFNNVKYTTKRARLYCLPVHLYGTSQFATLSSVTEGPKPVGMDEKIIVGELIIEHQSDSGFGQDLLICIPVCWGGNTSLLDDIVDGTPGEMNQIQNLSLQNYNFSQFIPSTQYYYYNDRFPIGRSNSSGHVICFDPKSFVPPTITGATYEKLMKLFTTPPYKEYQANNDPVKKAYNSAATNMTFFIEDTVDVTSDTIIYMNFDGVGDTPAEDIYIDCQPTGEEKEVKVGGRSNDFQRNFGKMFGLVDKAGGAAGKPPSAEDILESPYFVYIMGIGAFFITWKLWTAFGAKLKGGKPPSAPLKGANIKTGATVIKAQNLK